MSAVPELVAEPEPAEERLAAHLDSGSSCSDSGCTQEQAEHKWLDAAAVLLCGCRTISI